MKAMRHRIQIILPYLWFFLLALIILYRLIGQHEFWGGSDTDFHINSVYESAMQIKTGHFSYFLSGFGFERSGRITNALYGPIFNYLCGGLLLLCHSWIRFEFVLFLITLTIGGTGFYLCARVLCIHRGLATFLASCYLLTPAVLWYWIGNFEFTGLGAAILLPFAVLMGIRMVQRRQLAPIPLAVLMAICLQIHLMTSLTVIIALLPFFLVSLAYSRQRCSIIINGVKSGVLAFCLSGNIFGALYDVGKSNYLIPTWPNFDLQKAVSGNALIFRNGSFTILGTLYTIILIVVLALVIYRFHRLEVVTGCLLIETLLFFWLSSLDFPWDRLAQRVPALESIIQFPSRFVTMVFLLLLLLLGRLITSCPSRVRMYLTIAVAILLLVKAVSVHQVIGRFSQVWRSSQVVRYTNNHSYYLLHGDQLRKAFRSYNPGQGVNAVHKITTDYLPTPHRIKLSDYYRLQFSKKYQATFRNQNGFHKNVKSHQLIMNWNSKRPQQITIPLVKYAHTKVILNRRVIHPQINLVGAMRVNSQRGVNHLRIEYQPGRIFKILSVISVISWALIVLKCVEDIVDKKRAVCKTALDQNYLESRH